MSLNWAMLDHGQPVNLPGEQTIKTIENVSFQMSRNNHVVACKMAKVYVSNQRLTVVPSSKEGARYKVANRGDKEFLSFSASHKRIFGGRIYQPWIGPNGWQADILAVKQGGLQEVSNEEGAEHNGAHQLWQARLIFRNGGAFEFTQLLNEQVSLAQAHQDSTDPEPLPAYSET